MRVVMVSKALVVGAYQRKAEEIARLGVELTVLVPESWRDRRGDQQAEQLHVDGYELKPIPIRFNGHYHLHHYPTLKQEVGRVRPDILHMDEEPYNLATWQGLRIADKFGALSLFFTWQNIYRRYPPPFRWLEQENYRRTQLALAGNHAAASVLATKGFDKSITVLPQFGVDPEIFSPSLPDASKATKTSKTASRLRIGYAGGLLPEKGVDDLLRACAQLDAEWHLHIVGEGEERSELQALAKSLDIADAVTIDERIDSHLMPSYYQKLDTLVLPSRTQANWKEQFGRVLIEAMACEVAVIGSDSGEIPNVLGCAGLTYPEGDIGALAAHLQQLADDKSHDRSLSRNLGQKGRQRVIQNYSMSQIAQETVQAYEQILRN